MRTYYQMAHNQAITETPHKAKQSINSHYNIALLADYEQVVNAMTDTKSQSSPDTPGANTDQTKPKTLVMSQDLSSMPFTEDTDTCYKPSLTGHVLPLQQQQPGLVHGIPAGYESDDSWDTALTAGFEPDENSVTHLTYQYHDRNLSGYKWGHQRGHLTPHSIPGHTRNEPGPRPWDNQLYGR